MLQMEQTMELMAQLAMEVVQRMDRLRLFRHLQQQVPLLLELLVLLLVCRASQVSQSSNILAVLSIPQAISV